MSERIVRKQNKNLYPNIVNGGIAIPIGNRNNYYYMKGRKHSNGGIDIGDSKNGLEVEDGEVLHVSPKEIKVFSSVPFLNGKSPAQKVMGGENPTTVFKQQEQFKDRNKINDDGTKKKRIGGKAKPKFDDWYKTVPKEINDTTSYNLRRAYELLPYNELETWRTGKGHLRSVAPTENGDYEFLKSKNHPTYQKEIEWYNSPDAAPFREEYTLDDSTEYPKYRKRNKKRMGGKRNNNDSLRTELSITHPQYKNGGLSRSKDYGSKYKPYPSVKSGDFAGGHRSYPIPTKADAIDALRLAGLHGRSDVKAKVYNKYPELKKKIMGGRVNDGYNTFVQQYANDAKEQQYNTKSTNEIDWDKIDDFADTTEKVLGFANLGTSISALIAPNPYTLGASYITGIGGTGIDVYQGIRSGIKGDYAGVTKNVADIGLSLIGLRALRNASKLKALDKAKDAAGIQREYVRRTIGRGKGKRKLILTKEMNDANINEAIGFTSIPAGTAMNMMELPENSSNKKDTTINNKNYKHIFRDYEK